MKRMVNPIRLAAFFASLAVILGLYIAVLYKLQIIEGDAYYEQSQNSIVTTQTVSAARGSIFDRYGRLLASSNTVYNLTIDTDELFEQDDPNSVILEIVAMTTEAGFSYNDTLPITAQAPFEYIENMTLLQETMLDAYISYNGLAENASAVEVMSFMRSRYEIDNNYDSVETRVIAGLRYELNVRYLINTSAYVFAENVSTELITRLLSNNIPGIEVKTSYERQYNTDYASHLIGYVGEMTRTQYEIYSEIGYNMDAMVGQIGAESAFEEYLHGTDGEMLTTSTSTGVVTGTVYTKEPEPGDNIFLTIDIELQAVAEQALAEFIAKQNEERRVNNEAAEAAGKTEDIKELITGGSIVALDVNSGEPLAIASYPTYNLSTVFEDFEELLADTTSPMYNRALQGTYNPGSTFKIVTAMAALNEGVITAGTTILDETVFMDYDYAGYTPKCWIAPGSHGVVNVVGALTVSCNYFFYKVGDMLGIDRLSEYAYRFGLGEATGIELYEEVGTVASAEYKEEVIGEDWYAGDTLQAAMGQSYNEFTPLQMAIYTSAIANGGTRYGASLLKEVRSYDGMETLYERTAEIIGSVGADSEYFDVVQEGMAAVVSSPQGTGYTVFHNYQVKVAAKTGTAEQDSGSNTATFICFAPVEAPEIAVVVVMEKGASGSSLAGLAKEVLDYYYSFKNSASTVESEMVLLK